MVARCVLALALALTLSACGDKAKKDLADAASDAAASMDPELRGVPQASKTLLITSLSGTPSGDQLSPGTKGELKLPGQTVSIDAITTLKKVADPDTGQDVRAADGERLLLVELKYAADDAYAFTRPEVQVLVNDNGSRTRVFDDAASAVPFVVSASDKAELVLAVDGHDVKASLTSGARKADPVADLFQRDGIRQDVAKPLPFDDVPFTVDGEPRTAKYTTTVQTVELTSYLPKELNDGTGRWAPKGRAYLLVTATGDAAEVDGHWVTVDKTIQTWAGTSDQGAVKSITNPQFDDRMFGDASLVAVLEAPIDVQKVDLTVTAKSIVDILHEGKKELDHGAQDLAVKFG